MSQTGTIISVSPVLRIGAHIWIVDYIYALDTGGVGENYVVVSTAMPIPVNPGETGVAMWVSATSTITVPINPPGTANPVTLACPPQIQNAMFGVGFPSPFGS